MIMTLTDIFLQNYKNKDTGIHLVEKDSLYLTYHEFSLKVLSVLSCFRTRISKKEIILYTGSNYYFLLAFWAAILGKYIPVPITTSLTEEHINKLVQVFAKLESPVLLTDRTSHEKLVTFMEKIGCLAPQLIRNAYVIEDLLEGSNEGDLSCISNAEPSDYAFIQFSSGSTGAPKGVLLTHENLVTNIKAIVKSSRSGRETKSLSWMPLSHDMGLIGFHLSPYFLNIDQWLMPPAYFIQHPQSWLNLIEEQKITQTSAPNFGLKYLIQSLARRAEKAWDLSSLRLIYCGAEPISYDVCREFLDKLKQYGLRETAIFPVYGLAEASLGVTFPEPDTPLMYFSVKRNNLTRGERIVPDEDQGIRFIALGTPIHDCHMRICVGNEDLGEDTIGEVRIKGKNVTSGYYKDPKTTEESFDPQGWFKTGDLGFLHNGALYIVGRSKEVFFVNGQNYLLYDVERVLEEIREIGSGRAAVCVIPTSEGEKIFAFTVYKKNISGFIPLYRRIKNQVAVKFGFELNNVIPVHTIPRTTSGKIQRHKLVQAWLSGEYIEMDDQIRTLLTEDKICTPESIRNELQYLLYGKFSINLGFEDNFMDAGIPSIRYAEILTEVETTFAENLHLTDLFNFPNIKSLSHLIYGRKIHLLGHKPAPLTIKNSGIGGGEKEKIPFYVKNSTILENILDEHNLDSSTFLLAIFAYLFYRGAGTGTIAIHTIDTSGFSCGIIDFTQAEQTDQLIEAAAKRKIEYSLPLNVLSRLTGPERGDNMISLFIDGTVKPDLPMMKNFQLVLACGRTFGEFTLYYDSGYFDKDNIEEFVSIFKGVLSEYAALIGS